MYIDVIEVYWEELIGVGFLVSRSSNPDYCGRVEHAKPINAASKPGDVAGLVVPSWQSLPIKIVGIKHEGTNVFVHVHSSHRTNDAEGKQIEVLEKCCARAKSPPSHNLLSQNKKAMVRLVPFTTGNTTAPSKYKRLAAPIRQGRLVITGTGFTNLNRRETNGAQERKSR